MCNMKCTKSIACPSFSVFFLPIQNFKILNRFAAFKIRHFLLINERHIVIRDPI